MEKIELNKRTLRTLSMSEIELVGGASEDGDEEPDGGKEKPKPPPPPPPPPPDTSATVCYRKSEVCPPTANLACCPNSGD